MTLSGVLSRIHPIEANWFLSSYVVAAGFSVLLLAVLWSEPKFPDFLAPAQKFGAAASFSLYAIHLPIVTFLAAFAAKYVTSTSPNVSLALALGATILMIPGSWMFAAQTEARTSQFREFLRKCARRLNHSKSRGQAGAH
jgi:peptidoglycan/LPS O-acetylase OafA/YrhL